MDWLFPSIKNALFPSKSTSVINDTTANCSAPDGAQLGDIVVSSENNIAALSDGGQDQRGVIKCDSREKLAHDGAISPVPKPSGNRQQNRRRSSLSDLDTLLKKENQRVSRTSDFLTIDELRTPDTKKRHARNFSLLDDFQHTAEGYSLSAGTRGGSIGDMINLKLYGSNRSLVSGTSSIAESVPLETVMRKKTHASVKSCTNSHDYSDDVFQSSHSHADSANATINYSDVTDGISNGGGDDDPLTMAADDVIIVEERERQDSLFGLIEMTMKSHGHMPQRTPSITERAERLSLLIRSRQGRCQRHFEEVAV